MGGDDGEVATSEMPHDFWGILLVKSVPTPLRHVRGRLQPIQTDGPPVVHVVDTSGAVLLAQGRFHVRIAGHPSAERPRPPDDLSSGWRR